MDAKYEPIHRQASARDDDETIMVDENLVSVLEWLWSYNYCTYNSCQNNQGRIWIEFDLSSFKALVRTAYEEIKDNTSYVPSLHEFLEECEKTFHFQVDGRLDSNDEWVRGDTVMFSVSIRFGHDRFDDFQALLKQAHI